MSSLSVLSSSAASCTVNPCLRKDFVPSQRGWCWIIGLTSSAGRNFLPNSSCVCGDIAARVSSRLLLCLARMWLLCVAAEVVSEKSNGVFWNREVCLDE